MELSEHFNSSEFLCPCCRRARVAPQLIQGLEELRRLLAAPVIVSSGFRCRRRNADIGGTAASQHPKGRAADVHTGGRHSVLELYQATRLVPVFLASGIGIYPTGGFVHVDVLRPGAARWGRVWGKLVPFPVAYAQLRAGTGAAA